MLVAGLGVAAAATFGGMSVAGAQEATCESTGYQSACVSDANVSADAADPGDLPVTGSDPTRPVAIGGALIVAGGAAVAGSIQARRRSGSSWR
jgi:hypothetical protein